MNPLVRGIVPPLVRFTKSSPIKEEKKELFSYDFFSQKTVYPMYMGNSMKTWFTNKNGSTKTDSGMKKDS